MTDSLDSIKERIRALRAKAADAASSEAEAQTAAAMAAKLLLKFDLSESQLGDDRPKEEVIYATVQNPWAAIHTVQRKTAVPISKLTETKVWVHTDPERRKSLRFAGMPSDVEMALYLTEMLRGAAERGWMQAYMDQPMRDRKQVDMQLFRDGFYGGMGDRVAERIEELALSRSDARRETGSTALVVAKRAVIAAKLHADGFYFQKSTATYAEGSAQGRAAGERAGDRVGLGRPIASSSNPNGVRALR